MTIKRSYSWSLRALLAATALGMGAGMASAADPIKIGVIAEAQAIAGASIPQAAQLAADEINAQGGVDGEPGVDGAQGTRVSVGELDRGVRGREVEAFLEADRSPGLRIEHVLLTGLDEWMLPKSWKYLA